MEFTSNDPEEVKVVREIEELIDSTMAMRAAERDSFLSSFAGQLTLIVKILRTCNMPQETINMVLAARCGLPVQGIDLKSPCFRWVDDEPVVQQ